MVERENQGSKEIGTQGINWVHGQIALNEFKKQARTPEQTKNFELALSVFFEQEMNNTRIFTGSSGEQLPYTKISVSEFAKELLARKFQTPADSNIFDIRQKHHKYFIFPSFPGINYGTQFTFVEKAFMLAMQALPGVIRDLREGKKPTDIEIYTFGAPTQKTWGKVTLEYLNELRQDAYKTLGGTYADLVASTLPQQATVLSNTAIILDGHSMAASMAEKTAEQLLANGIATQDHAERKTGRVYTQVLMDAPVTLNASRFRKWQLIAGFAADTIYSFVADSHLRQTFLREGKFIKQVKHALSQRKQGVILPNTTKSEVRLKKQGHKAIMHAMFHDDLTVDGGAVRAFIRRGSQDLTIPPFRFARRFRKKEQSYKEKEAGYPLGKTLVQDPQLSIINKNGVNVKEGGVHGTHNYPLYFTKNSLRKWQKAVDAIEQVQSEPAEESQLIAA